MIRMKRENTKQKLLDVAIDLFSKKGYDVVSVREITRHVGVKESALYNHFRNKADILDIIIDIFIDEVGKTSFPLDEIDEGLKQMDLSAYLQYQLLLFYKKMTPRMAKIWQIIYMEQFRNKKARDVVLNEIMGRPDKFYKKVFQVAFENDKLKTTQPETLAKMYQYTLLSLSWEQMLRHINGEDISNIIEKRYEIIRLICD